MWPECCIVWNRCKIVFVTIGLAPVKRFSEAVIDVITAPSCCAHHCGRKSSPRDSRHQPTRRSCAVSGVWNASSWRRWLVDVVQSVPRCRCLKSSLIIDFDCAALCHVIPCRSKPPSDSDCVLVLLVSFIDKNGQDCRCGRHAMAVFYSTWSMDSARRLHCDGGRRGAARRGWQTAQQISHADLSIHVMCSCHVGL